MLSQIRKTDHQIEAQTKGLLYCPLSGKDIKVAQVLGWLFVVSSNMNHKSPPQIPIIYLLGTGLSL